MESSTDKTVQDHASDKPVIADNLPSHSNITLSENQKSIITDEFLDNPLILEHTPIIPDKLIKAGNSDAKGAARKALDVVKKLRNTIDSISSASKNANSLSVDAKNMANDTQDQINELEEVIDATILLAKNAKVKSVEAKTISKFSKTLANEAKETSELARSIAMNAKTSVIDSKNAADRAIALSEKAKNLSESAHAYAKESKWTADNSKQIAIESKQHSEFSVNLAKDAKSVADSAKKIAEASYNRSLEGISTAESANKTAQLAQRQSETSDAISIEAKSTAELAQSLAFEAKSIADSATVTCHQTKNIADSALLASNQAKSDCEAARLAANQAECAADHSSKHAEETKDLTNSIRLIAEKSLNIANETHEHFNEIKPISIKAFDLSKEATQAVQELYGEVNHLKHVTATGVQLGNTAKQVACEAKQSTVVLNSVIKETGKLIDAIIRTFSEHKAESDAHIASLERHIEELNRGPIMTQEHIQVQIQAQINAYSNLEAKLDNQNELVDQLQKHFETQFHSLMSFVEQLEHNHYLNNNNNDNDTIHPHSDAVQPYERPRLDAYQSFKPSHSAKNKPKVKIALNQFETWNSYLKTSAHQPVSDVQHSTPTMESNTLRSAKTQKNEDKKIKATIDPPQKRASRANNANKKSQIQHDNFSQVSMDSSLWSQTMKSKTPSNHNDRLKKNTVHPLHTSLSDHLRQSSRKIEIETPSPQDFFQSWDDSRNAHIEEHSFEEHSHSILDDFPEFESQNKRKAKISLLSSLYKK